MTVYLKILNYRYIINFLVCLLPVSFIAGNLSINLNVVLIIFFTLINYRKDFFLFKLNFIDKLLIFLFFYTFFIGLYNYLIFPDKNNIFARENFFKSLAFFRYLLFYISIKLIISKKIFNYKNFFIVSSLCVLFVSLDIIYQLIFGKDIFGNLITSYKLSGPFGSEKIAGSYLQRFSIFLFFLVPIIFNFKNKNNHILVLSGLFLLIFYSMVIAGNRMPLILLFLMFLFLFLIEKRLRKFSLVFIISSGVFFLVILKLSPQVQEYTEFFIRMSFGIFVFLKNTFLLGAEPNITSTYINELYSGYVTWKENLFFGGGINFFYLNCSKVMEFCSSHPHNYYLEILSEIGIVGFITILIIIINLITIFLKNKNSLSLNFNNNLIFPFFLLLFAEFFPIKTSGSFFTTGNSTFIFLLIAIVANLPQKYIPIE